MKKFFGIIGEKLGHTFSPQIHERIFKNIGVEGNFDVLEIKKEDFHNTILSLKTLGCKGITVTIPYKVDIMKQLDEISEEARNIGAVNVISFKDGKAIGYNSDYYGFGMTLDKFKVKVKSEKAVILGTGGASKAVVQYLVDNGIDEVVFATRNIEEAKSKYPGYKIVNYKELEELDGFSMVINCTPVGMEPKVDNSPITKECIKKFKVAVDIIYNPLETLFLKYAKEEGLVSVNGLYMLVAQAVKAQEFWNDINIDYKIIDPINKEIEDMIGI
ncbi:MAG: shikimate dehydrogenase [Clostridium sp.]